MAAIWYRPQWVKGYVTLAPTTGAAISVPYLLTKALKLLINCKDFTRMTDYQESSICNGRQATCPVAINFHKCNCLLLVIKLENRHHCKIILKWLHLFYQSLQKINHVYSDTSTVMVFSLLVFNRSIFSDLMQSFLYTRCDMREIFINGQEFAVSNDTTKIKVIR